MCSVFATKIMSKRDSGKSYVCFAYAGGDVGGATLPLSNLARIIREYSLVDVLPYAALRSLRHLVNTL